MYYNTGVVQAVKSKVVGLDPGFLIFGTSCAFNFNSLLPMSGLL
jgi:hypothetical protein